MADYIPGICNIGPYEINRRRRVGWIGLVAAIILFAILAGLHLNPLFRILIFFPITFSAAGFLQAYFHFCAGFARKGVFNFDKVGKMQKVGDDSSKAKDRQKGNKITIYAAVIGIVITILSIFINVNL